MRITSDNASVAERLFRAFIERREREARDLLDDGFTFTSPYDDAIDRDAYFERCWPNGDRFRDFVIERTGEATDGAYVTYRVTTLDGTTFRNTEFLSIRDGKVIGVHVFFGATYRGGAFIAKRVEAQTL